MMKNIVIALLVLLVMGGTYALANPLASMRDDIEVTIRHTDGTKDTFKENMKEMQIIVGADSMIKYLHLTIIGDDEKGVHAWYNVDNIASFRYKFLAITGRGKVKLVHQSKFKTENTEGYQKALPLQSADDFK
ncbi:hypothetical protein BVX97_04135 [bacterium E08(2017)]|nr:hypothetical protein BVX97_04135 [bacterium E08(2017)]